MSTDRDPFEGLQRPDLRPERRRMLDVSRDQLDRHGRPDAATVWKGPALSPGVLIAGKANVPVVLSATDDGMLHCHTLGGSRVWSVSTRPPNTVQVKRGAIWISRIDGSEEETRQGRLHPYIAYLTPPDGVVVPFLGLLAAIRARRASEVLRAMLLSIGAQLG